MRVHVRVMYIEVRGQLYGVCHLLLLYVGSGGPAPVIKLAQPELLLVEPSR